MGRVFFFSVFLILLLCSDALHLEKKEDTFNGRLVLDDLPTSPPQPTPSPTPAPLTPNPTPAPVPPTFAPTPIPTVQIPLIDLHFPKKECLNTDDCNQIKLVNRSTCNLTTFTCICRPPFLGSKCEYMSCGLFGIFDPFLQTCRCFPGYTGQYCTTCIHEFRYEGSLWTNICCNSSGVWVGLTVPSHKTQKFLSGELFSPPCFVPTSHQGKKILSCDCQLVDSLNQTIPIPTTLNQFVELEQKKWNYIFYHLTNNSRSYGNSVLTSFSQGQNEAIRLFNTAQSTNNAGLALLIIFFVLLFISVAIGGFFGFRYVYRLHDIKLAELYSTSMTPPKDPKPSSQYDNPYFNSKKM